jgi:hypothetical protein
MMVQMMQRPLMFTVEVQEEWNDDEHIVEARFMLRANGREVYRQETSLSSDTDDAEEWAAHLLFTVIGAALQAERDNAPRWEEMTGD